VKVICFVTDVSEGMNNLNEFFKIIFQHNVLLTFVFFHA